MVAVSRLLRWAVKHATRAELLTERTCLEGGIITMETRHTQMLSSTSPSEVAEMGKREDEIKVLVCCSLN